MLLREKKHKLAYNIALLNQQCFFPFLIKSHIMYSDLDTTMYNCVFLLF